MNHQWVKEANRVWTVCKNCTAILRQDKVNENSKCEGTVKVSTRKIKAK